MTQFSIEHLAPLSYFCGPALPYPLSRQLGSISAYLFFFTFEPPVTYSVLIRLYFQNDSHHENYMDQRERE
jgi:hypothetical protein